MKPGEYNLEMYQGDTYYGGVITLPSLAPFGGPSTLAGAAATAQIRQKPDSEEALADFAVVIIDATARTLRLTMSPTESANLPKGNFYWDLQIAASGAVLTPLAGRCKVYAGVTRP